MKFLLIIFMLAAIQYVKSEIHGDKLLIRNKRNPRDDIKPATAAAKGSVVKERSLADETNARTANFQVNNSEQNKRQLQYDLVLKRLLEDVVYIKKTITKISYPTPEWLVIQRRQDGSEDFDRTWLEYKEGFGNPQKEFFIGLQTLHEMTSTLDRYELLIIMEDFESRTRHAKYNSFRVGSEDENYVLKELGDYSGDAGDSMYYHRSRKFSTKDRDNDNNSSLHCAQEYKGGWWFDNCYSSFLNGPYYRGSRSCRGGINWYHWHNYTYSLKFVEMMIRKAPPDG